MDSHLLHRVARQMVRERRYKTEKYKLRDAKASTSERVEVVDWMDLQKVQLQEKLHFPWLQKNWW